MKYFCCILLLFCLAGCSLLGVTNEDAGNTAVVSNVTLPANGSIEYKISRNPRTDASSRQYNKDMSVSRSFFGWFRPNAGKVRAGGQNGS